MDISLEPKDDVGVQFTVNQRNMIIAKFHLTLKRPSKWRVHRTVILQDLVSAIRNNLNTKYESLITMQLTIFI